MRNWHLPVMLSMGREAKKNGRPGRSGHNGPSICRGWSPGSAVVEGGVVVVQGDRQPVNLKEKKAWRMRIGLSREGLKREQQTIKQGVRWSLVRFQPFDRGQKCRQVVQLSAGSAPLNLRQPTVVPSLPSRFASSEPANLQRVTDVSSLPYHFLWSEPVSLQRVTNVSLLPYRFAWSEPVNLQ